MAQNKNLSILKFALGLFAAVAIVYGIGLVFFTEKLIDMSGTAAFEPNWIRWPGATLAGLGIGAIFALRNPANQDAFVIAIGLGTLFTGLTLLYQLLFDWQADYNVPFTAVPCALNLAMSVLLWVGKAQAK
jgi:hypothetical protein